MTRTKKTLLAVVGLVFCAALIASWRVASYRPLARATAGPTDGAGPPSTLGYPWRGAIHVHTTFSDGAAGVEEVAGAAAEAGLDFLIVTDHNPMRPEQRPDNGWYGGVFVIFAEEISTDQGHLLAFGVPPHTFRFGPTARQALADIRDAGGWALVAHPTHAREPWTGAWGATAGLEVANLASAWSRGTVLSGSAAAMGSLIDRDYAAMQLVGSMVHPLEVWDAMTRLQPRRNRLPRPRVAVGGADAHGPIGGPLRVPSYADTLAVLSTLVWLDEPPNLQARRPARRLLKALRAGRAAVELTAAGDARGFDFMAIAAPARMPGRMGDLVAAEAGPWTLRVDFDSAGPYKIVLLRDGIAVAESDAAPLEFVAEAPGTYRAEIHRPGVAPESATKGSLPWVVGNPIYVWPAAARAAANVYPAPPLPAPPATRDLLAEAVFKANQFGATENDPDSRNRGLRWEFEFAPDSVEGAFAALAWRLEAPQNWRATDGLVIRLSSPRPLRVELQVRTEGVDGARELWVYSAKAGLSRDGAAIPWERFQRPRADLPRGGWAPAAEERPYLQPASLRRVTGVFLIVTPGVLARPGGRVWLGELGLYGSDQPDSIDSQR